MQPGPYEVNLNSEAELLLLAVVVGKNLTFYFSFFSS
jgi:hypothetical protein